MKTLSIYQRTVLERTQYRKWRYKQVEEVIISYDGKEYKNCYTDLNNPKLKIKFNKVFESRSIKELEKYLSKLGKTDSDKFIKNTIEKVVA